MDLPHCPLATWIHFAFTFCLDSYCLMFLLTFSHFFNQNESVGICIKVESPNKKKNTEIPEKLGVWIPGRFNSCFLEYVKGSSH